VAATYRDLAAMVTGHVSRGSLLRVHIFPLTVPPLRERQDDIPLLVGTLPTSMRTKMHKCIEHIHVEAMVRLVHYDWPGNVRELQKRSSSVR